MKCHAIVKQSLDTLVFCSFTFILGLSDIQHFPATIFTLFPNSLNILIYFVEITD